MPSYDPVKKKIKLQVKELANVETTATLADVCSRMAKPGSELMEKSVKLKLASEDFLKVIGDQSALPAISPPANQPAEPPAAAQQPASQPAAHPAPPASSPPSGGPASHGPASHGPTVGHGSGKGRTAGAGAGALILIALLLVGSCCSQLFAQQASQQQFAPQGVIGFGPHAPHASQIVGSQLVGRVLTPAAITPAALSTANDYSGSLSQPRVIHAIAPSYSRQSYSQHYDTPGCHPSRASQFYNLRSMHEQYQASHQTTRLDQSALERIARQAAPQRISPSDLKRAEQINWPLALREPEFQRERAEIQQALLLEDYSGLRKWLSYCEERLIAHARDIDPDRYIAAKQFLAGLKYGS